MKFLNFSLLLISLFIYIFTYDFPESKIKTLDDFINTQMKELNLKTVGLIIVSYNLTLYKKIYGEDNKVTFQTPFILGSVSKSFTALAFLHLKNRYNISLNETLDKFGLGDYIDEKDAKDITLGELLNHTSGLDSFSSKRLYKKGFFNYSNYGFALLGKVIEKQSDGSYHDYLKQIILDPLKMNNTYVMFNNDIIDSYDNFLGFRTKYKGLESEIGDGFYVPAGFISSSIDDMGNYVQYYLNSDNDRYVSQMTEGTIEVAYNQKYGMGMIYQNKSGQIIYKHNGATNSFLSLLSVYPKKDLGFFIVTNTRDGFCSDATEILMNNIERFLLYDYYEYINIGVIFYTHFTIDIIILIFVAVPLTYLIISIVRKIKKKKYSWFIGIKGVIIFLIDIFVLIIYPVFLIISFYVFNSNIRYLAENSKDIKFLIWTTFSTTLLTFIVKLIYVFVYNKFFRKYEGKNIPDIGKDLDYFGVED